MYLWHVCVCADLKNLNVEQFGNGESRCWCTRWIPCSGHILFGSQIAWSPAGTSPKKIEKENPSKIDINMMVLSVWGLWGLRWIPAWIKRIQTAIQQKNAEKNIKDVWKVGFTCQLLSPIPAQALVKGWRTFLRMPRVPASNSRLSKPFPNRPRLSWSPQQTLPTSPFTGEKWEKDMAQRTWPSTSCIWRPASPSPLSIKWNKAALSWTKRAQRRGRKVVSPYMAANAEGFGPSLVCAPLLTVGLSVYPLRPRFLTPNRP